MNSESPRGNHRKFNAEKLQQVIEKEFEEIGEQPAEPAPVRRKPLNESYLDLSSAGINRQKAEFKEIEQDKREEILADFHREAFSSLFRFAFCAFFAVLLIWLEAAAANGYIMPSLVSISRSPLAFALGDTVLLMLAAVSCGSPLLRGGKAIFTFSRDADSFAFLAFLGAFVLDLFLLFQPGSISKGHMIYSGTAAAVMAAAQLGRRLEYRRAAAGLSAFPVGEPFYSLSVVRLRDALPEVSEEDDALVLCPVAAKEMNPDREKVFSVSPADQMARVLSPVIFLFALVAAVLSALMGHGGYAAFASFAAVCCMATPACFALGIALPFARAARRLSKNQALITGYQAVRQIGQSDTILADANFLFPPDTVAVHGIKTFNGEKIEQAILDATSVTCAAQGPLADAFKNLFGEENQNPLEEVSGLAVEDDLGLRAVTAGRPVLLGNRELLRKNGVEAPSREYEAKYAAQGREIVYLAVGQKLHAMFIVGYYSDKETLQSLKRVDHRGFSLFLKTSDANITPSLIAERIGESHAGVAFLNAAEARRMNTAAERSKKKTGLAFSGYMRSYADSLLAAVRLRNVFRAVTGLQLAGAVLGALIVLVLSITGGMDTVSAVKLISYQALWAVPTLLIGLLSR